MKNEKVPKTYVHVYNSHIMNPENELLTKKPIEDMMNESVPPPSYMWSRIEEALEQQDQRMKRASEIINSSFKKGTMTPPDL